MVRVAKNITKQVSLSDGITPTPVILLAGSGSPTSGTTANSTGKASLYFDTANGFTYINFGTGGNKSTWVKIATV